MCINWCLYYLIPASPTGAKSLRYLPHLHLTNTVMKQPKILQNGTENKRHQMTYHPLQWESGHPTLGGQPQAHIAPPQVWCRKCAPSSRCPSPRNLRVSSWGEVGESRNCTMWTMYACYGMCNMHGLYRCAKSSGRDIESLTLWIIIETYWNPHIHRCACGFTWIWDCHTAPKGSIEPKTWTAFRGQWKRDGSMNR